MSGTGGNCKTWSIAGDKRITGLCSMEMLMETARTMRDGCPICVTPVQQVTGTVPVNGACVTWFCPIDFRLPLCSIKFEPVAGYPDCGVCATPLAEADFPTPPPGP